MPVDQLVDDRPVGVCRAARRLPLVGAVAPPRFAPPAGPYSRAVRNGDAGKTASTGQTLQTDVGASADQLTDWQTDSTRGVRDLTCFPLSLDYRTVSATIDSVTAGARRTHAYAHYSAPVIHAAVVC